MSKKLENSAASNFAAEQTLFNQLPFTKPRDAVSGVGSWWDVPPDVSYADGCQIGAAHARAFLAYLRESAQLNAANPAASLQHVVLAMLSNPTNVEDTHRGQVVGFFSALDSVLRESVLRVDHANTSLLEKGRPT